jgi:hypothetical protein
MDEEPAHHRPERHRHSAHQRVHRDAHRALVGGEHPRDETHRRGQRDGGPREEQRRADDHRLPGGHEDDDQEAGHRDQIEDEQRALRAQAIGEIAAGEGVERAEQIVHAVEEADRDEAAAERHQVERQELLGHVLAHADEHDHAEQADQAAPQTEVVGHGAQTRCR